MNSLHDLQYLRVLRALDPRNDTDLCLELASGDPGRINAAFRKAADEKSIKDINESDLVGYKERES